MGEQQGADTLGNQEIRGKKRITTNIVNRKDMGGERGMLGSTGEVRGVLSGYLSKSVREPVGGRGGNEAKKGKKRVPVKRQG